VGPTDGADGVVNRKFSVINVVFTAMRLKTKLLGCEAVQFAKFSINISEEPADSIFMAE
jgi:hypothetical protein